MTKNMGSLDRTLRLVAAAILVGLAATGTITGTLAIIAYVVAAVFVLLDAFLLAVLTVLVYGGAVVALFLFIIMLLDMQGGDRKPFTRGTVIAGTLAAGLLVVGLASFSHAARELPSSPADSIVPVGSNLKLYAEQLFTVYLLPVQIVGFLLLIAMLGVIVLSKKFPGLEDVK